MHSHWPRPLLVAARVAAFAAACFAVTSAFGGRAWATSTKEECLESHGRGQDLRDAGRLTAARQAFMACAQSACPPVIQADCARFGEELDRLVPSVAFAARDAAGRDLTDTVVYVDDAVTAARLDDGKPYELDPGKHTLRFVHDGHETTTTVVLSQGEKARSVVATFGDARAGVGVLPEVPPPPAAPKRSLLPLVVAGVGALAAGAGAVVTVVGLGQVPDNCSVGSRQCVAAPGDPSFDRAHNGVATANFGLGVGVGGAAVLVGGVVWYFLQPAPRPGREVAHAPRPVPVSPWLGAREAGVTVSAGF